MEVRRGWGRVSRMREETCHKIIRVDVGNSKRGCWYDQNASNCLAHRIDPLQSGMPGKYLGGDTRLDQQAGHQADPVPESAVLVEPQRPVHFVVAATLQYRKDVPQMQR